MGIDISSKLIVGLPYEEFIERLSEDWIEILDEKIDDGDLDSASPWYDSPRDSWIVGINVTPYGDDAEILAYEIDSAVSSFIALGFNLIPRLYCSPHVY